MWWLLIIPAAIVIFLAAIVCRALAFKPKAQPSVSDEAVEFDRDRAVDGLAQLVRFKTVSYSDHSLEDEGEFEALIEALPKLYPNVFSVCEFTRLPDRALLFRWKGKSEGNPAVLMAHYDVVPVNEDAWDVPAFEAILKEGCIWGRGTLDPRFQRLC